LQDKLLAIDDYGVPGVVSAGIASHDRKVLGENVNDFTFAFVTPLGADDDGSLTLPQVSAPSNKMARYLTEPEFDSAQVRVNSPEPSPALRGRTHASPAY
jgi:hypothetical protein